MSTGARILSLIPAATDWVTDLGLADGLVGVTHECDAPPGVPVVVEPAVQHAPADPAGVDAAVTAAASAGRPLYRVDEDRVAALAPTIVITQRLCDVCAVAGGQVDRLAERLGCRVVTLDGVTLDGVLDDAVRLGGALGAADTARTLVGRLRSRLGAVGDLVAGRGRPAVAFLEWPDPPWGAGHWVPCQIAAAGGRPSVGQAGRPSERAGWDAFAGADVLVVGPCGYNLDEAVAATEAAWDRLPATPGVWAIDAGRCFSRPAAGLVDGVEALACILHPDVAGAPGEQVARRVARARARGSAA